MYPYLYPNVNWIDETFKDRGVSNKYTIEFRGEEQSSATILWRIY